MQYCVQTDYQMLRLKMFVENTSIIFFSKAIITCFSKSRLILGESHQIQVVQIETNSLKSGYLRVVYKTGKWELAKEFRAMWSMTR